MITADTHSDGRVVAATAAAVAAAGAVPVIVTYPASRDANLEPRPPSRRDRRHRRLDRIRRRPHGLHRRLVGRRRPGVQYASLGAARPRRSRPLHRPPGRPPSDRHGRAHRRAADRRRIAVTSRAGSDLVFHNRGATVGAFRMVANRKSSRSCWRVRSPGRRTKPPCAASSSATAPLAARRGGPDRRTDPRRRRGRPDHGDRRRPRSAPPEDLDRRAARSHPPPIAHVSIASNRATPCRPAGSSKTSGPSRPRLRLGRLGRPPRRRHFDFTCRQVSLVADGAESCATGSSSTPSSPSTAASWACRSLKHADGERGRAIIYPMSPVLPRMVAISFSAAH